MGCLQFWKPNWLIWQTAAGELSESNGDIQSLKSLVDRDVLRGSIEDLKRQTHFNKKFAVVLHTDMRDQDETLDVLRQRHDCCQLKNTHGFTSQSVILHRGMGIIK